MKLDTEFYRLPLRFDAQRLAQEVGALTQDKWRPHPLRPPGNTAVPLVAVDGDADSHSVCGPMRTTPVLDRCPYIRQVLASFRTALGQCRLVRVDADAEVPDQVDTDYGWMQRLQIHVPVVTFPEVRFVCNDKTVHIPAGESWIIDTWRRHSVVNPTDERRVHLVMETVGSPFVWELVAQAQWPAEPKRKTRMTSHLLEFKPEQNVELGFEQIHRPVVMNPWEQTCLVDFLFEELAADETNHQDVINKIRIAVRNFRRSWRSLWTRFGDDLTAEDQYRQMLDKLDQALRAFEGRLVFSNGLEAVELFRQAIIRPALNPPSASGRPKTEERRPKAEGSAEMATGVSSTTTERREGTHECAKVSAPGQNTNHRLSAPTPTPSRDPNMTTTNQPPTKQQQDPAESPLRSVHTTNLPQMFQQAGISLLISTYQAGRLILARSDEGEFNTHFRNFPTPMGLACDGHRMAIGTKIAVWEFRNQPEVSRLLEPPNKHDACFLPRAAHVTGDISIHEIAWAGPELWIVNTRFSCLCTLDRDHSFVPRWRPPFISGLAPEDRCHLNGLSLVDGKPKYVTALGTADTPQGWRENKAFGGILMDVESGEIIAQGLSMPHSPRFYNGKLWVLESGAGSLSVVDLDSGKLDHVALLPGFTRGIDFYGPFAFIGLSQVRESAVFSGLPITERGDELVCGVWVVDIRNGQTVGFLRFEDGVQEIFAVGVVANSRFPELLNEGDNAEIVSNSWVLPDEALKEVQVRDG